jgi:hypothetical protein
MVWTGRVISAVVVLMLLFSAAMKLARPVDILKEFDRLGYPESVVIGIGITELVCALIFAFPRTAMLGAILLTGYLGGAIATHVRIADPYFGPVIGGVLVWLGLYLRDARVRALVPWRS